MCVCGFALKIGSHFAAKNAILCKIKPDILQIMYCSRYLHMFWQMQFPAVGVICNNYHICARGFVTDN